MPPKSGSGAMTDYYEFEGPAGGNPTRSFVMAADWVGVVLQRLNKECPDAARVAGNRGAAENAYAAYLASERGKAKRMFDAILADSSADSRIASVMQMRYMDGMPMTQVAERHAYSRRTCFRLDAAGRAWMRGHVELLDGIWHGTPWWEKLVSESELSEELRGSRGTSSAPSASHTAQGKEDA